VFTCVYGYFWVFGYFCVFLIVFLCYGVFFGDVGCFGGVFGRFCVFFGFLVFLEVLANSGHVRKGQVRSGQFRQEKVMSGQAKSGHVKSGQARSSQDGMSLDIKECQRDSIGVNVCLKCVKMFQGCFKGILRMFQRSF